MKTVNPFNHRVPHAKLVNVKLTSITRLKKHSPWIKYIEHNDVRNYAYSRADELAKRYGYIAPGARIDQETQDLIADKFKNNAR